MSMPCFSWCKNRRLRDFQNIQPARGKWCHVLAQPMARWTDGSGWTTSGKFEEISFSSRLVLLVHFVSFCGVPLSNALALRPLDSRLSTGLPGRKRGFSLHLCPDWMLVGSWFEVFKCYSCSWQAETWSGSSVLLSNFSLSTTIWEKLVTMASSTTMGSMTFMTVMTPAQSMDMRYWVKKFYKDASDWNDSTSRLAGR